MTTIVQADDAIINHFIDEWGNTTPIAKRNQIFAGAEEFVRPVVKPSAGENKGVSSGGFDGRLIRQYGLVIVQVFVRDGGGVSRLNQICQQVLGVLSQEIDGVELKNGYVKDVGSDGAGYYQQQVIFEYQYDYVV